MGSVILPGGTTAEKGELNLHGMYVDETKQALTIKVNDSQEIDLVVSDHFDYIKESPNKIELGDVLGNGNGTKITIDDPNLLISMSIANSTSLNIDRGLGLYELGDIGQNYNSMLLRINDNSQSVFLGADIGGDKRGFLYENEIYSIGDINNYNNGTKIVVDDANQKVTTTGHNVINELGANPTLTAGSETSFYMKGDKFIIAYNDGGTVKYRYLNLTSTDATWTYTTTAP